MNRRKLEHEIAVISLSLVAGAVVTLSVSGLVLLLAGALSP
jgi:hypothetical protein